MDIRLGVLLLIPAVDNRHWVRTTNGRNCTHRSVRMSKFYCVERKTVDKMTAHRERNFRYRRDVRRHQRWSHYQHVYGLREKAIPIKYDFTNRTRLNTYRMAFLWNVKILMLRVFGVHKWRYHVLALVPGPSDCRICSKMDFSAMSRTADPSNCHVRKNCE